MPRDQKRARGSSPALQDCARAAKRVTKLPSLPPEIYKLVAERLAGSPGSLLRLSMVCVAARDAVLRDGEAIWFSACVLSQQFYFRHYSAKQCGPAVVRNIPMKPYPNFKRVEGYQRSTQYAPITWQVNRARWPVLPGQADAPPFTPAERKILADHALRSARLEFARCCGLCGEKNKHVQVWGLGKRVCSKCMKENHISAAALFHEYGFDFNSRAADIAGSVFYFREAFRPRQLAALVTHNPVDFKHESAHSLVFFWRPHLEKVLDLPALRRQHRDPARALAAQKITGAVRALRIRLFLAQKSKSIRGCNHAFHLRAPAAPKKSGGAYTVRPLSEVECDTVFMSLPLCCHRRQLMDRERDARRLLQESFVGYRGRNTLPLAKFPEPTLEKLRILEAFRAEQVVVKKPPSFLCSSGAFRSWLDLPPRAAIGHECFSAQ